MKPLKQRIHLTSDEDRENLFTSPTESGKTLEEPVLTDMKPTPRPKSWLNGTDLNQKQGILKVNGHHDTPTTHHSNGTLSNGTNGTNSVHGRFHVNWNNTSNGVTHETDTDYEKEELYVHFAGRRDVRTEKNGYQKIYSKKGTVRGFKNRVKAGIATFQDDGNTKDFATLEKGMIVIYITSMSVIRKTHDKCKKIRQILQNHMVKYEERDIFMSCENQEELRERLGIAHIEVPQVFLNGEHLGDAEKIEALNESGELRQLLKTFPKASKLSECDLCGGFRYIPCTTCHGSKKSLHRNHFTAEFTALRCIVCDENGLVKCDLCNQPH